MKNILSYIEKEDIAILSNGIIATSSFIGVLSATIYYIADIKGIYSWVTQIIITIYILAFLIVTRQILKIIKRDKNEDRN